MGMASYVNAGAVSGTTGSVTSLTPALPGSRVTGNILIATCQVIATGKTISVGGGWIIVDSDNTNGISCCWAWRTVDGTEAAPVFSWTGGASGKTVVMQFSATGIGPVYNKARGASQTVATIGSITTSADNSLMLAIIMITRNNAIGTPSGWTLTLNHNGAFQGSLSVSRGTAADAGSVSDSISHKFETTPCDWVAFGIEILGSGASAGSHIRATQVLQETLESYSNPTNLRATQVLQETLESYSNPTNLRATQVILEVLRTQSAARGGNFGGII